jgi:hypothetical protein
LHKIFIAFICQLIFVFLKAFQQRNVAFNNFLWVVPTSLSMAIVEYAVVAIIVKSGYNLPIVLAAGTGAALGCVGAMFLHERYVKKGEDLCE